MRRALLRFRSISLNPGGPPLHPFISLSPTACSQIQAVFPLHKTMTTVLQSPTLIQQQHQKLLRKRLNNAYLISRTSVTKSLRSRLTSTGKGRRMSSPPSWNHFEEEHGV
ncbi:unnamed protein product [Rhodiola kirilowii]